MSAALSITPASGSITAAETACKIDVTGADVNDLTAYDSQLYPTSPEIKYYLLIDAPAGTDDGRSYVFGVDSSGGHQFNNYIFPAAGSYTVRLRKAADDSDAATLAVTVS
jgi:hypothetical protein